MEIIVPLLIAIVAVAIVASIIRGHGRRRDGSSGSDGPAHSDSSGDGGGDGGGGGGGD